MNAHDIVKFPENQFYSLFFKRQTSRWPFTKIYNDFLMGRFFNMRHRLATNSMRKSNPLLLFNYEGTKVCHLCITRLIDVSLKIVWDISGQLMAKAGFELDILVVNYTVHNCVGM